MIVRGYRRNGKPKARLTSRAMGGSGQQQNFCLLCLRKLAAKWEVASAAAHWQDQETTQMSKSHSLEAKMTGQPPQSSSVSGKPDLLCACQQSHRGR